VRQASSTFTLQPARPAWAAKILALREQLDLNQTVFGQTLQSSAMAVSRWERGAQEPSSHTYIAIGNLAGDPDCWYFWGRAGLRNEDVMKVMPEMRRRLQRVRIQTFEIVKAGAGSRKVPETQQIVAIPLLKIVAASPGANGDNAPSLHDAPVESMIAAPKEWCPHPASTRCLRVKGHSMAPTICDGYIVAVDTTQTDRSKLDGKIVIAWNKDTGLMVSRFKRYGHTEVLQPENPRYESSSLTANQWNIVATVLWWIGKAP